MKTLSAADVNLVQGAFRVFLRQGKYRAVFKCYAASWVSAGRSLAMDNREKRDEDPGEDFWPQNVSGLDMVDMNMPAYMSASGGNSAFARRPEEMTRAALGQVGHDLPDIQRFNLENMVVQVRREVQDLNIRVTRLEQQLPTSPVEINQDDLQPRPPTGRNAISRSHLDRVCLPILEQDYGVSQVRLVEMAERLERLYPNLERRAITSAIRKWFRKRREEMGSRITSAMRRHFPDDLKGSTRVQNLIRRVEEDRFDFDAILNDARLEILDPERALNFIKEKTLSFLRRYRVH